MSRKIEFLSELALLCEKHSVQLSAEREGATWVETPVIEFNFEYKEEDYGDFENYQTIYFDKDTIISDGG